MAQWTVKCGMCKHSKTYSGYISVVACDLAECKFDPIVCTASNKTELLPKDQWQASITTIMEENEI